MRLLPWLLFCSCASAAFAQSHNVTRRESGNDGGRRVVCYYTNWSVYRPGTAKFSPQNINPYLCTHLIYAFGGLTRENGLRPYDKYQDIEQGGYAKFTGLKTYNKNLKTMVAIGGWNEGSTRFSPLVADEERRAELVHNVVRFLRQNHFDGLDLDWEYPAFRDGGKPRDRQNYALLVQELRQEFDRESSKTGRPRLLLTMAVPAGIEYIDKGYDIPKLNRYLDFMNILSYDYHSAFEPAVNHHSPLYPLEEDSEYNFDAQLSIDYTISHYLKLGADRDKLVLGIPTYGRSYTLFNPLATEIGSPADGPGEQGDATREKGYLAYYEICESVKTDSGWKVEHPNPGAMGPYAYKGNQWVGYDDIDIVKLKSRYVSENGLGGIMFWSIDNDDFRGKCHGRPYPLIEAGKEALLASSTTSNDVVTSSRGGSKTRNKKPSPTVTTNSGGRQSGERPHKRRPTSGRRNHDKVVRSTTTTTTTTTPKYNYPQTTPEPPTTPDPGSDFMCKDEGFFPHPRDCKKYFWCLDSGPSNLGIVAHQFTCPSGLFFNKAADSCDYARNVVCKKKSATASTTTKAPITSTAKSTTRLSSGTTPRTTTTTTTTTTPEPPPEEEYDDEEYEDEEDAEEDPQALKELLNLIKKLGGVEQLEKQLQHQGSDQNSNNGQVTTSGFSRTLYDKVLKRNNNNRAFSGGSATTPRYSSVYRNRPERPQNEGLEGLEEVAAVRREKPQYVTISRNRPAAAAPEEVDDDEEEESFPAATHEEANRGDHGKSQQVEYVTIRRARPSTEEPDTTTPKYITLTRSRRPPVEQEQEEEAEVTTEIRPVYVPSTERDPESRLHIVTPSRPRKLSRAEELPETTTLEPERKVSVGRPQYVDITSFRRHGNPTTSIPEDDLHYVEVNSLNRRRYAVHDNEVSNSEPTTLQDPSPTTVTQEETSTHKYIETTQVTEKHTETFPTTEETLTPKYTETLPNIETQTPKFTQPQPRRRGSTTPTTTQPPTTTLKTRKPNSRRRGTTSAPSTLFTPQQTTPPPATTPLTPTSTRFTPTVTRVITSVTESGTTERQRIAINRVPYIAIAALRGETVYPGPVYKHKPTFSTDQRILNPASNPTTPMTSVEHNTIPVTQKLERVMEVNMVVPVEVSTNDTTETTVTVDKISEVTRYKYVTVVDNTQTTNSSGEYTTESLSDVVSTLPTNSDFTAPITEPSGSGTIEETSSTEIPSTSVSPAINRRRQGAVRRPGVDDFQRRRTRPPFTRSTTEASSSSTQSSFSLQRRGQRKRPRPYRPDNEVRSTSEPTEDSRKPFVPKRGQRKRPSRPSTLDVSENNILVTSEQPETSSRFVPRGRGNRRRTTTSKPVTETKSTPKRGRISTSTVEIKDLDELFTTNSPLSETTVTGNRLGLFPKKGSRNRYTTTVEPTVRTTFYEQETTEQTSGTDEANTETEATTLPSTSLNDIVRGTTFRPSSLRAYTQSTESNSDRVKIVKRRRRPVTRSSEADPQSTPQPSQNEVETSVTPFATDALLERENYDVTTGSVGGNVEKGGKQVNSLIDTAAVQKSSQPDSDPNDFETPSESIKLTTIDDTDLNTDTSGYASVNSIRTLGASVKSSSEEVLKEPVEPQTEGPAKKTFLKNFKTKLSTKEYFNASVEFTTDSFGSSTTEEPEKDRKESSLGDQKVRRLVKKKKTTQAQSEVVTTARTLRRPAGSFYNRTRQRGTTSTTSTTSSTTEAPTSTTASSLRRRPGARVVRRRKYGDTANSTRDNDATASQVAPSEAPTDKDASSGRVRKFSFPRRRQTTTPVPATTTPPHSDMQLLESSDHQATEVDEQQVDAFVATKLPDLANSAVAAIHNLATSPPGTQTTSEPDVVKTTRITTTSEVPQTFPIVTTTPAAASVFPRRGSTIYVSQPAAPASPLPPPRRGSTVYVEPVAASHVTSVAPPRRGSTVYIEPVTPTTPAPAPRRLPGSATLRPRPFSRTSSTSSRPKAKLPPIIDYEYYDDEDGFLDVAPVSGKVKIHSDGYIECLDRGNFPHPFSCKKFISCAKMENGELLGWEYTCPRQLSFDPIGGICNWSAGLGCKE